MSFDSIERIIDRLLNDPAWEKQRQYLLVRECWVKTVNSTIVQNTRLLSLDRHLLFIATPSAAWAHNLSLQRYQLLQRLNSQLPFVLADLRFSPVGWHTNSSKLQVSELIEHPSQLKNTNYESIEPAPSPTPAASLARWLSVVAARSQFLPLCPQCQTPTPDGELDRWQVCTYCFRRNRSS
jgi:predicted nucleic acid-binding Zn ribbon protein